MNTIVSYININVSVLTVTQSINFEILFEYHLTQIFMKYQIFCPEIKRNVLTYPSPNFNTLFYFLHFIMNDTTYPSLDQS